MLSGKNQKQQHQILSKKHLTCVLPVIHRTHFRLKGYFEVLLFTKCHFYEWAPNHKIHIKPAVDVLRFVAGPVGKPETRIWSILPLLACPSYPSAPIWFDRATSSTLIVCRLTQEVPFHAKIATNRVHTSWFKPSKNSLDKRNVMKMNKLYGYQKDSSIHTTCHFTSFWEV